MVLKNYTHFTQEERYQLAGFLQAGMSISKISRQLGKHRSTIYREKKRGTFTPKGKDHEPKYMPKASHDAYLSKRFESREPYKFSGEEKDYILEKLDETWSVVQSLGRMSIERPELSLSHSTVYRAILRDKKAGGALYKKLRHRGKKYKKSDGDGAKYGLIDRISIEQRDKEAEDKRSIGDWEADLICSNQASKKVLITVVDRPSKCVKIGLVDCKDSHKVRDELERILLPLKDKVRTITFDNGREFAQHKGIAGALDAKAYFASPYHPWERGLNEHTNGLIREFFPKGSSFEDITLEDVERVENLLNNRPRKVLGFRTPNEVFFQGYHTHGDLNQNVAPQM